MRGSKKDICKSSPFLHLTVYYNDDKNVEDGLGLNVARTERYASRIFMENI